MGDATEPPCIVLITGFGPFGKHKVNASWAAVRELKELVVNDDFILVTHQIPVVYAAVDDIVPALWKQRRPKLVIHVGVSGEAKQPTLEQQAHNDGYMRTDIRGELPDFYRCHESADTYIQSSLSMQDVSMAVVNSKCGVDAVRSLDLGRFLCDYIYCSSLLIDDSCTAFIHVPPLNKPYTVKQSGGLAAMLRGTAIPSIPKDNGVHCFALATAIYRYGLHGIHQRRS